MTGRMEAPRREGQGAVLRGSEGAWAARTASQQVSGPLSCVCGIWYVAASTPCHDNAHGHSCDLMLDLTTACAWLRPATSMPATWHTCTASHPCHLAHPAGPLQQHEQQRGSGASSHLNMSLAGMQGLVLAGRTSSGEVQLNPRSSTGELEAVLGMAGAHLTPALRRALLELWKPAAASTCWPTVHACTCHAACV